ncbi:MAG: flagellar hook-basal body complex protein [Clostridiales bacterium]|jgi:flagellar hook protein FlgE|nr:flagellar hook-basal body complex protein [Clostridiales bacterium]
MMRSLYSGVSGLKNHQARMDVIGNNISNVNTAAYKSSRVVFQDIYSQTVKTASAGTATLGGTNPAQIGLGVSLGAIDIIFTSSATQRTDNPSDLAIEGDGFFVIDINGSDVGGMSYTRAGNFYVDNAGYLVTSDGYFVMGYDPAATPSSGTLEQINLTGYTGITFDDKGMIWGLDSTDTKVAVSKIALALFTNNSGLEKMGGSLYSETGSSGEPVFSVAQQGGAGKINPGGLEMSNVDLASEFTDMIVTQRGFQANSRIITTSDALLEELVNLKR